MRYVWTAFEVFINILEAALDVYLFACLFPPKPRMRKPFIATFATAALFFGWLELTMTIEVHYYIIQIAVLMLLCYGYLLLFRQGHWAKKLFWVALANAMLTAIIYVVSWLQVLLTNSDISTQYTQGTDRFVNMSLIHILFILFVWFATRLSNKDHETTAPQMLAMVMLSATNICVLFLIEYTAPFVHSEAYEMIGAAISIGMLLSSIVTLWLFDRLSTQARAVQRLRVLEGHFRIQKQFLGEIELLYNQIRMWRHDYQHHMEALQSALARGETAQAQAYIAGYLTECAVPGYYCATQHVMLDALLSTKLMRAKREDIDAKIQIVMPKALPISDTDICTLLGNLLDNSIEACQQVDRDKRFIELSMLPMGGNLSIKISNATADEKRPLDRLVVSTKKQAGIHGIGLQSIDAIVQNAQGFCVRKQEHFRFTTTIVIPMK